MPDIQSIPGPFIIQNIETEKYLQHIGNNMIEHPFRDVEFPDEAEQYKDFDHVSYVAFWYAEYTKKWRIIDLTTKKSYIHDTAGRFKPEPIQAKGGGEEE